MTLCWYRGSKCVKDVVENSMFPSPLISAVSGVPGALDFGPVTLGIPGYEPSTVSN